MASIKKNFIYQVCYQILTMVLPLITAPYISRVLHPENVGIYSYTYSVANYFVQFANLGIATYGSRVIAQVRDNQDKLNQTFSSLFALHGIISLLSLMVYGVYVTFGKPEYRLFSFAQGIYIVAALFDINWLFFGLEKFKLTVTRNMVIKLITVACVFLFVKTEEDLLVYMLIMALGMLSSQCAIWLFVRSEVRFVKPDGKVMLGSIKPLIILFIATIATSVFRTIGKVMLGEMATMEHVGCFENADKMIMFPIGVITALGTIMLPRMSQLYKTGSTKDAALYLNVSVEFAFVIASALCFGLMAIAKDFSIVFFGDEYALTGEILRCISITIPLIAFNNVIRTQYIIPKGKDQIYLIAVCLAAAVNVILNLLLIPRYASYGAGAAVVAAYVALFSVQLAGVRKELNVGKLLRFGAVPLLVGFVMFLVVDAAAAVLPTTIGALVLEVAIGAAVFILLMLLYFFRSNHSLLGAYIRRVFTRNKINERK